MTQQNANNSDCPLTSRLPTEAKRIHLMFVFRGCHQARQQPAGSVSYICLFPVYLSFFRFSELWPWLASFLFFSSSSPIRFGFLPASFFRSPFLTFFVERACSLGQVGVVAIYYYHPSRTNLRLWLTYRQLLFCNMPWIYRIVFAGKISVDSMMAWLIPHKHGFNKDGNFVTHERCLLIV